MSVMSHAPRATSIQIPVGGGTWIDGDIAAPGDARGVVLLVHGSGSGRDTARNRFVAAELRTMQFATVLADLLTEDEEQIDEEAATVASEWLVEHLLAGVPDQTPF